MEGFLKSSHVLPSFNTSITVVSCWNAVKEESDVLENDKGSFIKMGLIDDIQGYKVPRTTSRLSAQENANSRGALI
jgi:hypothetical protein